MALRTVPEHVVTLLQRADWFHLQAGVASHRLRKLAALDDFPADWADFLFLISDDLERQLDAFESVISDLRQLEARASDDVGETRQPEEGSA